MKIIETDNYEEMSRLAADHVEAEVVSCPHLVLGLAAGSTPRRMYEFLGQGYRERGVSYRAVQGFNLDEYYGLSKEHPQSFYQYLTRYLAGGTDFQEENLQVLDALAPDIGKECREFEKKIELAGGIDLQILGLGNTGHIGFNEPDAAFPRHSHCVKLKEETVKANAKYFSGGEVPRYAMTMGVGTIMQARQIIMLVSGKEKAGILKKVLCGQVTPQVPASILQFHRECTVIADSEALSAYHQML